MSNATKSLLLLSGVLFLTIFATNSTDYVMEPVNRTLSKTLGSISDMADMDAIASGKISSTQSVDDTMKDFNNNLSSMKREVMQRISPKRQLKILQDTFEDLFD